MPRTNTIHIDQALTNMSVAYAQAANAFIADKVFPTIPVVKQSDVYFEYNKDDFFRDEARKRAKGTESAGGQHSVKIAGPYFCEKYAFHEDVFEEDRVNADSPIDVNRDAMENVMNKLLIRRETLWAETFFTDGVWGTDYAGVSATPSGDSLLKWNLAASDPIRQISGASIKMQETTGKTPNTLVLSPYVYDALMNHEDVLDRIKYTQKGIVTGDILAMLFGVDKIYVPRGIKSGAPYQVSDADAAEMSFIMGKHALLCYSENRPGIKRATAGYTFAWKGYTGASNLGTRIQRIPMPWLGPDTERIEGEMAFDMKVIAPDLGVMFNNIVD